MYFNNQMFNANYVSPENYHKIMEKINQYYYEQNRGIQDAVKAFHDYIDAMQKLDKQHQQIANQFCLIEIARACNW